MTEKPKPAQVSAAMKMPKGFIFLVLGACLAPYLLSLLGVNFVPPTATFDLHQVVNLPEHLQVELFYAHLSGAFTHTILEWSAFCVAILTVFLAAGHYYISKSLTTLIIGSALFLAGCMDAFHTLAADRLIESVADNRDLIPFTWAICRMFNAMILIGGVLLLLQRDSKISGTSNLKVLGLAFVVSTGIAYAIIHYCAVSDSLPQTQYPDSIIKRPYDVLPLLLYLFAGLFLFPRFYHKYPSIFAHALIISMIPEVMVELHMAFGSTELFDNHFNIAHFLKILAYAVPFLGLLMDYIYTYQQKEREIKVRQQAEAGLRTYTHELERSNKELNDFAYVASHDLKAPLRGIMQLSSWIEEDLGDKLEDQTKEYLRLMHSRTLRLEHLLDDLLAYSRVGRKHGQMKAVDITELTKDIFHLLSPPPGFTLICDDCPTSFNTLSVPLEQILRNLINNAIKHHDKNEGIIRINVQTSDTGFDFCVADDGPGIAPEQHERIFGIFQTLKPRDEVEGSGMGLAIVKKLLDNYQCKITVQSDGVRGTVMHFNWPSEKILRKFNDE